MSKYFIILLSIFANAAIGQTHFSSPKYGYSFDISPGWFQKFNTVQASTDCKIADGNGNSFIVTVMQIPESEKNNYTVDAMLNTSLEDLETDLEILYGNCTVLKKGVFKNQYLSFFSYQYTVPFRDGLNMYHKCFMVSHNGFLFTIDAASISSFTESVAVYHAIMINSFKF